MYDIIRNKPRTRSNTQSPAPHFCASGEKNNIAESPRRETLRGQKNKFFKVLISIIYLVQISISVNGQNVDSISNLKQCVINNILLYRFNWLLANDYHYLGINEKGFLKPYPRILNLLPPAGCNLELSINNNSELSFADKNVIIIEFKKDAHDTYQCNDNNKLDKIVPPIDNDDKYLIGMNRINNEISYISGNFFLTDIRHYYLKHNKDTSLIKQFLTLIYFKFEKVISIMYYKENKNYYYFAINQKNGLNSFIKVNKKTLAVIDLNQSKLNNFSYPPRSL